MCSSGEYGAFDLMVNSLTDLSKYITNIKKNKKIGGYEASKVEDKIKAIKYRMYIFKTVATGLSCEIDKIKSIKEDSCKEEVLPAERLIDSLKVTLKVLEESELVIITPSESDTASNYKKRSLEIDGGREKNITIVGLEDEKSECRLETESKIKNIIKTCFKMEVEFDDVYRLGLYKEGQSRRIIARFSNLNQKMEVMASKKDLTKSQWKNLYFYDDYCERTRNMIKKQRKGGDCS